MWFTIPFGNIVKNSRRSLMTILAVGLGFGAINLFQGYVHSTYQGLTAAAIHGEGLGHLTIFKKGFLDKGKLHPEKFQFSRAEAGTIMSIVRSEPSVLLVTPRLSVTGILSNGRNSTIFIADGLVAEDDGLIRGDISMFKAFQGEYLADEDRSGVVVGAELARMLDLKQGSDAVVLSNTYSGMANALDVKVRGVYNTGASATNDKMVLMNFGHAQSLLDFSGAERLTVLLRSDRPPSYAGTAARDLVQKLAAAGFDVEIRTWSQLSVFYNQVKNMFDMIFFFIFTIVLVIVVMSVVNTMSMAVLERTREIGTMRALGFKRRGVKLLISLEGMLLGLMGSLLGSLIFFGVYYAIRLTNPTYVPPASSNPVPLRVALVWPVFVGNMVFMLALAMIAAFVPARRSSRMSIVDALGHV